jgi:hypothetical protein
MKLVARIQVWWRAGSNSQCLHRTNVEAHMALDELRNECMTS